MGEGLLYNSNEIKFYSHEIIFISIFQTKVSDEVFIILIVFLVLKYCKGSLKFYKILFQITFV